MIAIVMVIYSDVAMIISELSDPLLSKSTPYWPAIEAPPTTSSSLPTDSLVSNSDAIMDARLPLRVARSAGLCRRQLLVFAGRALQCRPALEPLDIGPQLGALRQHIKKITPADARADHHVR